MTAAGARALGLVGDTVYTHDGEKIVRAKVRSIHSTGLMTNAGFLYFDGIREDWALTLPKAVDILLQFKRGTK